MHYPTSTPQYSQQQQPSSFAILTPEQSSCGTSSAAGPGMIPLIPLSSGISSVPFGATGLSNPSNNNNNHNTAAAATAANPPQPLPASLTDEELQILATTSREAMEQRLRILDTVQNQIFQSMQILTQALSVFPNINNSNTDTTSNNNTNNINSTPADESSAAATSSIKATSDASTSLPSLSSTIEAESHTSAAQRLTSPPTSQTTKPFDITDQQQQSQSDQGISSAYSVVSEQEDGEDAVSSSRRRKGKMPELGSSSNEYQIASDQEE
ncbi:hypothetical protein BDB00DRAFT_799370 [Zychaea mexicana]|uniref:uncharacterized protein n=1 Tax=Zychaea mexicana TaxID=64656 RepID=UPI0022FF222A|nr:uncharacterized protein BDB00DRAFT_799370 [Zychaea mexicana]KAI9498753.1 hypothetical protein BDB00DRAFT_799370 [Zychaea mexicana]